VAYAEKPKGCVGCPAYKWGKGFVPPNGEPDAPAAFVGQGPGQTEGWTSEPFHDTAPIGQRFNKWLATSGIVRREVLVGNLVQCWLPKFYKGSAPDGNRDPTRKEMWWCWNAHVGPWLTGLGADVVVVPVGIPAAKFILSIPEDEGAEKFLGTLNNVDLPEVGKNNEQD